MGVAVAQRLVPEQRAAGRQHLEDRLLRLAHAQAREVRHRGLEAAAVVHGLVERQAELHAGLEVLGAVRRGGVDEPGARLERHVLAEDHRDVARLERMAEGEPGERPPGRAAQDRRGGKAVALAGDASRSSAARMSAPASVATSSYSWPGCAAMAWLPGRVHGVVVQMTAKAFSGGLARPKARATAAGSAAANATSIAAEVLSSYSTSASASADPQSMHQLTGLRPR